MTTQPQRSLARPIHPVQRWTLTATLVGTLAFAPLSAWSLTVGGMRVQSAVGQPLRAQLSIGELTAEELATVNVALAPAVLYQAAGIALNPMLNDIRITIDKSSPSNVLVNLTGSQSVSEPFVDLLLEIQWASGKLVRDYTLLLNPQGQGTPVVSNDPVIPAAPQVSDPNVSLMVESVASAGIGPNTETPVTGSEASKPVSPPASEAAAPKEADAVKPAPVAQAPVKNLRVVRGDTAGALAQAHLPQGVSLDQMLQAMLRANPSAFVNGNVNRLKAGVALTVPTAQEALAIDSTEARRLVVAQSKDFNAYRRALAANAPLKAVGPAGQVASGQIQTQVQDKAAAAPAEDQLTLSKGSVVAGESAEAEIAATKKAQDEQSQQDSLTRNIDELKALAQAAPGSAGDGNASKPTAGPSVPAVPEKPIAADTPATTESAAETSPVQSLIQQGWVLPAALGLLAVLLGLAFSRISRRKKTALAPVSSLQEEEPAANDQSMADSTAQSLILNLNDINLDLTPSSADTEPDAINGEALFTKLELAKEFLSLGDRVAAKALAEEVQAEATGLLKRRAELLLAELG